MSRYILVWVVSLVGLEKFSGQIFKKKKKNVGQPDNAPAQFHKADHPVRLFSPRVVSLSHAHHINAKKKLSSSLFHLPLRCNTLGIGDRDEVTTKSVSDNAST